MKVIRRTGPDHLWRWMDGKLPVGFEMREVSCGYGTRQYIYARGTAPSRASQFFFDTVGDPIAQVLGSSVEVYHPEFFSDFEDGLRRYESETKRETELAYWEMV